MDNVTYPHKSPSLKMCLGKQFQKSFCCGLVLFFFNDSIESYKDTFSEQFLGKLCVWDRKWKGTKYHSVVCRSSVAVIQHWQARNNNVGKCFIQLSRTCNTVSKWTQHVTSNSVGSCWPTMLHPFAQGFIYVLHLRWYSK